MLYNHSSNFYTYWYEGPGSQEVDDLCGAGYFGIQKKYENIHEDSCTLKKCTACEITNTHEKMITINLRGLCKDTYLDTQYAINYDPENIITYTGIERNVIAYDFDKKIWQITVRAENKQRRVITAYLFIQDVTNPNIKGVSKASKRSLALGTQVFMIKKFLMFYCFWFCFEEWTITNDSVCSGGGEVYTTLLSLTSCGPYQFTCADGLCVSIDER